MRCIACCASTSSSSSPQQRAAAAEAERVGHNVMRMPFPDEGSRSRAPQSEEGTPPPVAGPMSTGGLAEAEAPVPERALARDYGLVGMDRSCMLAGERLGRDYELAGMDMFLQSAAGPDLLAGMHMQSQPQAHVSHMLPFPDRGSTTNAPQGAKSRAQRVGCGSR